jgi:putative membrane protein
MYLLYYGLLCAVFAVSFDLWYDPVAVAMKWWTWTNPGPYYNVPTSNFIGWFVFAGLFCPAFAWVDSKDWVFRKKILVFFALLPLVLLITAAASFPFL